MFSLYSRVSERIALIFGTSESAVGRMLKDFNRVTASAVGNTRVSTRPRSIYKSYTWTEPENQPDPGTVNTVWDICEYDPNAHQIDNDGYYPTEITHDTEADAKAWTNATLHPAAKALAAATNRQQTLDSLLPVDFDDKCEDSPEPQ